MTKKLETTLFFAATAGALALAAVVALQEFGVGPAVQHAIAPVVRLEAVEVIAERLPTLTAVVASH